jgi:hypothetical protein
VVGALGIQPAAVQSPHVGGEGAVRGFEDGLVHQPLAAESEGPRRRGGSV